VPFGLSGPSAFLGNTARGSTVRNRQTLCTHNKGHKGPESRPFALRALSLVSCGTPQVRRCKDRSSIWSCQHKIQLPTSRDPSYHGGPCYLYHMCSHPERGAVQEPRVNSRPLPISDRSAVLTRPRLPNASKVLPATTQYENVENLRFNHQNLTSTTYPMQVQLIAAT
jgi:hypothetical protein